MLFNLVVVVQVLAGLAIVGLVLLQHGKGADMGAAFGSGASGSLFGATGSSNFMSKSTGVAAAVFFSATLGLAYMSTNRPVAGGTSVIERAVKTAPVSGSAAIPTAVPAVPASTPAAPAVAPAATAPVSSAPAAQIPK